ncbi:MAG: imidazoleglycerol-phosphate dehydratase HisB [Erysipelotrichaceae bacterium]|nr:imidazoleglycerol-phosphate dehydratase HisB [Erysipelotrichaceae bacterium]
MRKAQISRNTAETKITCQLDLEGSGQVNVNTGIGFFDHMLTLLAFHSGFDLDLQADGDLEVCDHHTVEDCGIVLGCALKEALGDAKGITRYGSFQLPMDEVLCHVTLDISGRPYLVYHCELNREKVGELSCEMVEEFLRALAFHAGITLHVNVLYGKNDHHKIEAVFKALARALKQAVQISGDGVQSSKGLLL